MAVTVTDLSVSVPWYSQLFAADAVLDEDTGPFRHVVFAIDGGMLFGLQQVGGEVLMNNRDLAGLPSVPQSAT